MPPKTLLARYGLARNPFTDRTAEKTDLDDVSLYVHSDLQNFKPSDETYLFFGKRGSGKTTIRLAMQDAYDKDNARLREAGERGHFIVDLCTPGHMTSCLKDFMEIIGSSHEDWDSKFVENWTTSDLVDCIYAFTVTKLVQQLTAVDGDAAKEADALAARLRGNSTLCTSFLVQAHLYARTDDGSRARLLRRLLPARLDATSAVLSAAGAVGLAAGGLYVGNALAHRGTAPPTSDRPSSAYDARSYSAASASPVVPRVVADHGIEIAVGVASATAVGAAVTCAVWRARSSASLTRACQLQSQVRVVKRIAPRVLAGVLDAVLARSDRIDTIRQMHIGVSAHQKLQKLLDLVRVMGYRSLAVFGDCFDEVTLLDPVCYPQSIKQFAKEVCRNDLLNFGRMHFFFPDSRVNLDLNTDKTLKEARFDRHFLRDMSWSRHQLEELAERRYHAAQEPDLVAGASGNGNGPAADTLSFTDLFKEVSGDDFAAYVNKLDTPRELMIMMTEMFNRIEKNPSGRLTAQDMEFAVKQAKEQSA